MSCGKLLDDTRLEPQIVLVMQGDQALWFRKGAEGSIESFSETIEAGGLDLHSCCPWIRPAAGSAMSRVQLVLDSHLDEVDRVRVPDLSGGWLRHLQCWRMGKHLSSEFPSAAIHKLTPAAAPDAMSVVHNLIPEHWQRWLALLQREHVSVSHAASSLDLLCRYSMICEGLRGKPVLFNTPVGEYSRHLLVDGGVPVFMRLVHCGDCESSASVETVQETLEHVRRQVVRSAEIPVITLTEATDNDCLPAVRMGLVLANLYLGGKPEFRCFLPGPDGQANAGEFDFHGPRGKARNGSEGRTARVIRRAMGRCKSGSQRWQLTAGHRLAGDLLQISVARNALQLRIRQLRKATLICTWLAAATVVVASVHGVASARERARLSKQHQQMAEQVEHLSAEASKLNRHPAFVVRTLERIAAHKAMGSVDAVEVLETVAEALDEFPALVLDDISWSVVYDEAGDAVFTTIGQAPAREHLWQEGASRAPLQVELGGLIISERGLREQQRNLEDFTDYLQAMPGVSAVKVLESPVSVARSSKHRSREESAYRLILMMGVS